jgi:DNA (cytosine-5)-methyltransferase 1
VKVLSLFSGVGGFDIGLERAGMEVVGQCEIDPFASRVLAHHWPGVPNYGDVRDVGVGPYQHHEQGKSLNDEARLPDAARIGHVDLVCGGFPCQDLSVAGKRAGLDGERSGLWFEFHRILSELRPAFCLIENVPGLLSSNEGRDFGVIVAGLEELGYCVGWAVLDSQHFGVPQRRRRVYIVGGPTRECVQQILSLCESGDWHSATGREAGQDVAKPLGASATSFGGQRYDLDNETYIPDVAYALAARNAKGISLLESQDTLIAHTLRADGFDASEDGTGRGTPLVTYAVRTGMAGANGVGVTEEHGHTLDSRGPEAIVSGAAVRRLTPVECERLQGFPDDWTRLDDRTPDGPRYKAMGNAVSVPVIEYLGRRILAVTA